METLLLSYSVSDTHTHPHTTPYTHTPHSSFLTQTNVKIFRVMNANVCVMERVKKSLCVQSCIEDYVDNAYTVRLNCYKRADACSTVNTIMFTQPCTV